MINKKSVLLLLIGMTLIACNNPSNVISESPKPQNSSIRETEKIKNIGKLKLVLKNNVVRKFDKNMNMSIYAGDINKIDSYINTGINENSVNKSSNELVLNSGNFRGAKIDKNGDIYFIGSDNSIYKIEYNN